MKNFFFAVLLALSSVAHASPVSLNFQAVPLTAFAQATFQSMMSADFVMSPDVVALDKKITISIKNVDGDMLGPFITSILQREGIKVTLQGGVYYLDLEKKSDDGLSGLAENRTSADMPFDLSKLANPRGTSAPPASPSTASKITSAQDSKSDVLESKVYIPVNRPADLIAESINGALGGKGAQASGDRLTLAFPPSKMKLALSLLDQLDYKPMTVEVSASWVEVTHQTGSGLGISVAANILGQRLGAGLGTVTSGSQLSLTGTNFSVVVDALNTDSRIKQVSNSRMLGDAGEKITFSVGDSTPTISSTSTTSTGNPVQNIVYQPSGVITNVTAAVLGSGKIHLVVDGEISAFQPTTSGVVGSPTLIKRQLKTVVTTADGEVLLIGGLNSNQSTKGSSAWAFFPWFASKADSGTQTDLVLVLSARVVDRSVEAVNNPSTAAERG